MPEYPPATSAKADAGSSLAVAVVVGGSDGDDLSHRGAAKRGAAARGSKACCAGTNDCKGKGNCKTDKHGCKGLNDCKGQSGCRPAACP